MSYPGPTVKNAAVVWRVTCIGPSLWRPEEEGGGTMSPWFGAHRGVPGVGN